MPAVDYSIKIEAGSTWTMSVTYKDPAGAPIDISGYLARMMVRKKINSPGSPLISLTDASGITITGVDGKLDLLIPAADTALLPEGDWRYDLEIESPGGIVTRLMEGRAEVVGEVTR